MTCFVDTDVLVAWVNRSEGRHQRARELLRDALSGLWGSVFVTDFVVDEALTLLMARGAPLETADQILSIALAQVIPGAAPPLPLARVSDEAYRHAVPLFRRHYRRGLSFTDCTSIAMVEERRARAILSFDRGFDGLIPRMPS